MNVQDFHKGMRELLKVRGGGVGKFMCPAMLMVGKVGLDIVGFDDLMHERHGEYEDKGLSMGELIEKEYGIEARTFCEQAIGG